MWILKLALTLAALYLSLVALAYVAQTWLIFPANLAGGARADLPAGAERLEIATADGHTLAGLRIPARETPPPGAATILGFGGNAWNADALAIYLAGLFPGREVVAVHYRGYAPSTGRASAAALLEDAVTVYDRLRETSGSGRIVAVGLSIGAGPAAHLAAERPLAGTILVTPFDSLAAMARHHYRWLPTGPLLRHRMEVAENLSRAEAPAAIITAGRDTIVPAARSAPVSAVARRLVLEREIAGAGHNDLYDRAEFAAAMREALSLIEAAGPDAALPRPQS